MRLAAGRASNVKPKGKSLKWSGPGTTPTASSAVNLQGTVRHWTTVGQRLRRRGGQSVQRKRDKRKVRSVSLKFGTLNVGTITG